MMMIMIMMMMMMMMLMMTDNGDDDETLRRSCCVKRLTRHMARVPFEGGEGGVPFSWSFKDKGSNQPLRFAK